MQTKLNNMTKYFGFVTVTIEWFFFLLLIILKQPNWSEPFSQYGYFYSTHFIFAISLTLPAITYYLFSRNLNKYWSKTSLFALISGVTMTITGWVAYKPYVHRFVFDVHNISITIALICCVLPVLFIGYRKVHHEIALISRILFWLIAAVSSASILFRWQGLPVMHLQLLSIILAQIWIVIVNTLLLKDLKTTPNSTKL